MNFVEHNEDVRRLAESLHESTSYIRPVYKSCRAHPASSELSFVFAKNLQTDASFVVAKNHQEVQRAPESAFRVLRGVSPATYVCSNLKAFIHSLAEPSASVVDLEMLAWWAGTSFDSELQSQNVVSEASNKLWHTPIYKLIAQLESESEEAESLWREHKGLVYESGFTEYTGFLPALTFLESEGICVDEDRFEEYFGDKPEQVRRGFVHPNYRLYTSTGRPSNAFGKVNYAALEKGEKRSAFVSRFDNGHLVELDYDAFHLRLIGDRVGYEFENGSVHRHLGCQYFDTDELSEEQYERSKKQTFFWLYNGLTEEALEYEFFRRVQRFIDDRWKLYNKQGYVETLGCSRKIYEIGDATPNKVFNYLIQSYETEVAISALARLRRHLSGMNEPRPRACLYTFDSFLFDCPPETDLHEIKPILSYNGKYPMSLNRGENYAQL